MEKTGKAINTLKSNLSLNFKEAYVYIIIMIVNFAALSIFYAPILWNDDWTHYIESNAFNRDALFEINNRRPLLSTFFILQSKLFGLTNLRAQYAILWTLHLLLAFLLYRIIYIIIKRRDFSLVISLLFLTYPIVYTRMWLTMTTIYYSVLLTFLYGYFLYRFTIFGRLLTLITAMLCLLLSFGMYEAQLGVAYLWALLIASILPKVPLKRRMAIVFIPMMILGIYAVWRVIGYQQVGFSDGYLDKMDLSINTLFSRMILGYKVSLLWGWTTTLQRLFPWLMSNRLAIIFLLGIIATIWWVMRYIYSHFYEKTYIKSENLRSFYQRLKVIRVFLISSIVGLLFIAAGYIPITILYPPNLEPMGSRVNLYASLGSGIFLASALMIGSSLFAKTKKQTQYLFLISAIPFLLIGIFTQAWVQFDNRATWRETQTIWKELIEIAPNLMDNTQVLFILPDFEDRTGFRNWKRKPLEHSREVTGTIRVLYDNLTLTADFIYPDITVDNESILTLEGVLNVWTRKITPYQQIVAFLYNNNTGKLQLLDEIPNELVNGAIAPIKLGTYRIIDKTINVPLRDLLE